MQSNPRHVRIYWLGPQQFLAAGIQPEGGLKCYFACRNTSICPVTETVSDPGYEYSMQVNVALDWKDNHVLVADFYCSRVDTITPNSTIYFYGPMAPPSISCNPGYCYHDLIVETGPHNQVVTRGVVQGANVIVHSHGGQPDALMSFFARVAGTTEQTNLGDCNNASPQDAGQTCSSTIVFDTSAFAAGTLLEFCSQQGSDQTGIQCYSVEIMSKAPSFPSISIQRTPVTSEAPRWNATLSLHVSEYSSEYGAAIDGCCMFAGGDEVLSHDYVAYSEASDASTGGHCFSSPVQGSTINVDPATTIVPGSSYLLDVFFICYNRFGASSRYATFNKQLVDNIYTDELVVIVEPQQALDSIIQWSNFNNEESTIIKTVLEGTQLNIKASYRGLSTVFLLDVNDNSNILSTCHTGWSGSCQFANVFMPAAGDHVNYRVVFSDAIAVNLAYLSVAAVPNQPQMSLLNEHDVLSLLLTASERTVEPLFGCVLSAGDVASLYTGRTSHTYDSASNEVNTVFMIDGTSVTDRMTTSISQQRDLLSGGLYHFYWVCYNEAGPSAPAALFSVLAFDVPASSSVSSTGAQQHISSSSGLSSDSGRDASSSSDVVMLLSSSASSTYVAVESSSSDAQSSDDTSLSSAFEFSSSSLVESSSSSELSDDSSSSANSLSSVQSSSAGASSTGDTLSSAVMQSSSSQSVSSAGASSSVETLSPGLSSVTVVPSSSSSDLIMLLSSSATSTMYSESSTSESMESSFSSAAESDLSSSSGRDSDASFSSSSSSDDIMLLSSSAGSTSVSADSSSPDAETTVFSSSASMSSSSEIMSSSSSDDSPEILSSTGSDISFISSSSTVDIITDSGTSSSSADSSMLSTSSEMTDQFSSSSMSSSLSSDESWSSSSRFADTVVSSLTVDVSSSIVADLASSIESSSAASQSTSTSLTPESSTASDVLSSGGHVANPSSTVSQATSSSSSMSIAPEIPAGAVKVNFRVTLPTGQITESFSTALANDLLSTIARLHPVPVELIRPFFQLSIGSLPTGRRLLQQSVTVSFTLLGNITTVTGNSTSEPGMNIDATTIATSLVSAIASGTLDTSESASLGMSVPQQNVTVEQVVSETISSTGVSDSSTGHDMDSNSADDSSSMSDGAIAGAVIGSVVGAILLLGVVLCISKGTCVSFAKPSTSAHVAQENANTDVYEKGSTDGAHHNQVASLDIGQVDLESQVDPQPLPANEAVNIHV